MNAEVSWLYEVDVKRGQIGSFRTLMAELVDSARDEAGTFLYEWSLSDDESAAHIREGYADSAATLSHLARFRATFAERFRSAVEPTGLVVYGNPSDEVKDALTALRPTYMSAFAGFAR
jgi:quinol monooxygenase YgiN